MATHERRKEREALMKCFPFFVPQILADILIPVTSREMPRTARPFLFLKSKEVGLFFCAVVLGASFVWAQETNPQDQAAEYFFYRCAGCHTVGAGKLSGPDLISASRWSEADLATAIKKMEKNVGPLTEPDVRMLIEFLKDFNVSSRIAKQKEKIEAKFRAELPPPSFDEGEKLFRGQKNLSSGGPACVSCHHFVTGGAALGPDLTHIKERTSLIVLQSALEQANYKIMRPIYAKHKISKTEALHLAEYLMHPEKVKRSYSPASRQAYLLAWGWFTLFFVGIWILNKRRKGPTRRNLLRGYFKR